MTGPLFAINRIEILEQDNIKLNERVKYLEAMIVDMFSQWEELKIVLDDVMRNEIGDIEYMRKLTVH